MSSARTPLRRTCAGLATAGLALAITVPAAAAPGAGATSDGPKNIIVMVGDGMGYNHVDAASLYQHGTSFHQVAVDPAAGTIDHVPGTASQVYQSFDVQVGMSTFAANGRGYYDPEESWGDFEWNKQGPTDSAASGTALATGVKTVNGRLGVDAEGTFAKNVAERASETGRATGVVSSVQFAHATPAAWGAHNANRNDNHGIGDEMIDGPLDVIIGAGHPHFDDDAQPRPANYSWLSEPTYQRLVDGQTPRTFVETTDGLRAIADGTDVPDSLFGLVPVATTLQQARSGESEGQLPFEVPANDVPDLPELSRAALNVLEKDEDGLFLMIEGGAIDWTGHANETTRNIEETLDFNAAVETVVDWVETESSWEETLVVVTADHETGYLDGADSDPSWTPLTGEKGQLPREAWFSGDHTNQLVPLYAQGAGADVLASYAVGSDPVRGDYLDNTDVARVAFELWGERDAAGEGEIPVNALVPVPGAQDGSLTLSVGDFGDGVNLSAPANVGDRLRMTAALPTFSVTDSRSHAQAGTGGWALSGQSSDLVSGERVLRADHLGWQPGIRGERPGVTPGSKVVTAVDGGEGLAVPSLLARAGTEGRLGTTDVATELFLELPVTTQPGDYAGTVAVSLFPVD
ncbi:alkaline phosphatase [Litorihabitans aurantiacus]|uniref:Alkaline phosphatase n=1 Tax=Litorihabitans aurantiacus TaxID=1930061 RepID=A0AA37UWU1_9MICO|nr:alkaline phosphatase [Litorihabitans aurantiacus]GMA30832.1 hypothetical protein GCM10025875_08240 [Litorihabitans aurantiacus]